MPSYLVETYLPAEGAGALAVRGRQARTAAEQLARTGTPVRFDRAIHLPGDETCFLVVDAPSSRDAALVAEGAGLDPVRVVEAMAFDADKEAP